MDNYKIPLFKVFMDPDVGVSVSETLQSGYIGQGKKVEEFEDVLSSYFETSYINTLNSATSGIHLALHLSKLFDKCNRNEVITTPLTCTATNLPILANGLKIKWADIDPETCNIDLSDVKNKINEKTLALVVVHWGGVPCDLDKINEIKNWTKQNYGNDIFVIEDCAHALGSKYKNNPIGNSSNFCVFSFQAVKQITTGDGGLIICPNKNLNDRAKLLRWYGLDRTSDVDYRCKQNIIDWGYKFHMNDIAATIGLCNFKHLFKITEQHNENYKWLESKLNNCDGVKTLHIPQESYSACWIMTLLVENRDDFILKMKSAGIQASPVHGRNDKHECFKEFECPLIQTDYVTEKLCCIPCGWWVTDEGREHIIETVKQGW
jgi:dTDP-4-amino-4,6-dideoxygalactose transaminase